ncbi:MAG: hypothetical protein WA125_06295 [Desulfosporosinus sp.]
MGREIPINQPRFEHRVPDTTVTNLLTGNQSDGGDTLNPELLTLNQRTGTSDANILELLSLNQNTGGDTNGNTAGFSNLNSVQLAYVTSEQHNGNGCISVNTAGTVTYEGTAISSGSSLRAWQYKSSAWVKAPAGAIMEIDCVLAGTGGAYTEFIGTGDWQYVESIYTAPSAGIIDTYIRTKTNIQDITFYIDDISLKEVATHGFTIIAGKDNTIESSTEQAHTGTRSLKCVTLGNSTGEGCTVSGGTITTGLTYIGGTWVKAPLNALMELRIYSTDGSTYVSFTGTGDWQWVEGSLALTAATGIGIWVRTKTNAQAITFYMDDCRLSTNVTTGYATVKGDEVVSITGMRSYQGYRCCKVVTDGSHTLEGIYVQKTGITNGADYAFRIRVLAPLGQSMNLNLWDGGGNLNVPFTGTGEWQLITGTRTFTATSTNISVTTGTQAAVTFYVDNLHFETGNIIHDWAYGGSSYSTYKTEYGCLIEEAHTNGVTANVSTGTDTLGLTTGFGNVASGVISSSTEEFLQGSKSLKVVTDGSVTRQGTYIPTSFTSGVTNTGQCWIKGTKGTTIILTDGYSLGARYTLTGDWQFISVSGTWNASSTQLYILTSGQQVATFYIDMLQQTPTAYPLSWTLGGTTQAAETLTAPSSVLNIDTEGYSNLLTANQANACEDGTTTGFAETGGATISVDSSEFIQGSKSLKTITGVTQYAGSWFQIPSVVNVTYTLSGKIKGNPGDTIYLTGSGWSGSAITLTLTGGWDTFELTRTASTTAITYRFGTPDTTSRTFYLDELQLTATSTVKPWIPGGTQSNLGSGTIEVEAYIPSTINEGGNRYIVSAGTSTAHNIISLRKSSSTNIYAVLLRDNASNVTTINTPVKILTGWNKFGLAFDSVSGRIFVNGGVEASNANPYLPSQYGTLYIGCLNGGTAPFNGIIRNVTISRPKRTDSDVTARANTPSGKMPRPDRQVSLYAPLQHNLKAWRRRV